MNLNYFTSFAPQGGETLFGFVIFSALAVYFLGSVPGLIFLGLSLWMAMLRFTTVRKQIAWGGLLLFVVSLFMMLGLSFTWVVFLGGILYFVYLEHLRSGRSMPDVVRNLFDETRQPAKKALKKIKKLTTQQDKNNNRFADWSNQNESGNAVGEQISAQKRGPSVEF